MRSSKSQSAVSCALSERIVFGSQLAQFEREDHSGAICEERFRNPAGCQRNKSHLFPVITLVRRDNQVNPYMKETDVRCLDRGREQYSRQRMSIVTKREQLEMAALADGRVR